jgi:hypothetical protein
MLDIFDEDGKIIQNEIHCLSGTDLINCKVFFETDSHFHCFEPRNLTHNPVFDYYKIVDKRSTSEKAAQVISERGRRVGGSPETEGRDPETVL